MIGTDIIMPAKTIKLHINDIPWMTGHLKYSIKFPLRPLLHDQIFFDKFHMSNSFSPCKLGFFDKFVKNS